jgi:esterase/lipase superfamily enzyme
MSAGEPMRDRSGPPENAMTRFKRRVLIGMALVGLILAALVVFFYRPTRLALERAEGFQFRRMLVAKQGEEGSYRFFYVTNRRTESDAGPVEERFENQRAEALEFGLFDTEIEPTLGIGMIINPSDWFQNEEIQLRDVQSLRRDEFIEQVRGMVDRSPHRALLVVVHGFREAFVSGLRKTAFLGHVLDIDAPVLVFDWPGNQGSTLRGYRRAQRVAGESGAEFARTLELIIREVRPERLWVVANSMGAHVVTNAFSVLYGDADLADAEIEIEDVVLTAPDVDRDQFDDRFKQEIAALARDLTVYVSSNDRALLMSRVINRRKRLGESSLDPRNPDQFDAAAGLANLIDGDCENITLVDVTPVNRTRNFHNFSLETPEFFDDLFLRLVNPDTPTNRLIYRVRSPDDSVYWVLTRGRQQ